MAITFVRLFGSIRVFVDDSQEEGTVETLAPRVASALFAESHMPFVGDLVRFVTPGDGPPYVAGRRVQGQDVPKTIKADPGIYEFACTNGISEYTVTVVGQDDSVTMVRGVT